MCREESLPVLGKLGHLLAPSPAASYQPAEKCLFLSPNEAGSANHPLTCAIPGESYETSQPYLSPLLWHQDRRLIQLVSHQLMYVGVLNHANVSYSNHHGLAEKAIIIAYLSADRPTLGNRRFRLADFNFPIRWNSPQLFQALSLLVLDTCARL